MKVSNKKITSEVQEPEVQLEEKEPKRTQENPIEPKLKEVPPVFKGSAKRRFFQYLDSLAAMTVVIALWFAIDLLVDILYDKEIADTQSSAQQFSIQDMEAIILASLGTVFVIIVLKLVLEVLFDSIHYFLETSKDESWTSFKAFKKLTPWQQWLVFLGLFYISSQLYTGILNGIT